MRLVMHRGFWKYVPECDWDEDFIDRYMPDASWVTPVVPVAPAEFLWRQLSYMKAREQGLFATMD
jgi:hypothetical protein